MRWERLQHGSGQSCSLLGIRSSPGLRREEKLSALLCSSAPVHSLAPFARASSTRTIARGPASRTLESMMRDLLG